MTPDNELVVPFVACESSGGPYDNNAFVAGFQMGQLSELLDGEALVCQMTIYSTLRVQADLIAMSTGYESTFEDSGEDEWTYAHFAKMPS